MEKAGLFSIGPYAISSRCLLAPMAGVTDVPFRRLCRRLGAGLAASEMVTADTSLWGSNKSSGRLRLPDEDAPHAVQIAGSEPAQLADAARAAVDLGAHIVDINMGCPAKKVCRKAAGSALLRDETLVASILGAVTTAVDVPVTLKIRTGWSRDEKNALEIARIAEQTGIAALAIHGRTRACRFGGTAEYDTIAAVAAAVAVPVIANGDIDSPAKAQMVLRRTGAAAVMIGRAAQGNPWIFRDINHFLATGEVPAAPGPEERCAVMLEHLESLYAFYGEFAGVRIARKHVGWYLATRPDNRELRAEFNQLESPDTQKRAVRTFFSRQPINEDIAA